MEEQKQPEAEPKPPKRKLWLARLTENYKGEYQSVWRVKKASGFYPEQEVYSEEELKTFLRQNDDVEPVLTY